jgi:transcriptional antiterminator NusG
MPDEVVTIESQPPDTPDPAAEATSPEAKAPPKRAPRAGAGGSRDTAGGKPPTPPEPPAPIGEEPAPTTPSKKRWYVVKVQSGREESIKEAIERRVKIEGLEEYFGQIIIPVERVTEMRSGKRVVRERKLYPGYLMVEVEYNDRILYLFRETSGVGDFVGGSVNHPPPPMSEREVERMLGRQGEHVPGIAHPKPKYDRGDRVKVKDGTFAGMEGEVKDLLEAKGLVRVELTIFGRPVPVELEYWQVEHT